ncbi:MAG: bacillithiol biosynthesis BshC, partial [Acidobacteria bacterium]|nr:bacillithiol biosynthesis BshC [Acidobacteriota bacterium]
LAEAGYHAQVHLEPDTSFVFLLSDGRRLTLREKNGEFFSKDGRFTRDELASEAAHLSPNALLRPVTQDWIFPTIAYIGGPAELAYMAQSQPIYHALLGRMPVILPRAGFTLLDARATKLMARYRVTLQDIFHGEEHLRDLIGHALMPATLISTYEEVRTSVARELDRLEAELVAFDPTLAAALHSSRAKILHQLSKNERKIARESTRRNERAAADATFLFEQVFPHKHLQERFYSILPFLARHGVDLVARVYENVQLDCPDHILLSV